VIGARPQPAHSLPAFYLSNISRAYKGLRFSWKKNEIFPSPFLWIGEEFYCRVCMESIDREAGFLWKQYKNKRLPGKHNSSGQKFCIKNGKDLRLFFLLTQFYPNRNGVLGPGSRYQEAEFSDKNTLADTG